MRLAKLKDQCYYTAFPGSDNVTTTSRFLSSTLPSFILDILNDCVRLSDDTKEFFILN